MTHVSEIRDRLDRSRTDCVVGLAAALVFAHAAPLAAMVRQWSDSPMYSYGFTVPIRQRVSALVAPAGAGGAVAPAGPRVGGGSC